MCYVLGQLLESVGKRKGIFLFPVGDSTQVMVRLEQPYWNMRLPETKVKEAWISYEDRTITLILDDFHRLWL